MNILTAYLTYATVIAIFHGFLIVTCLVCFFRERRLLKSARRSIKSYQDSGYNDSSINNESVNVAVSMLQMSRKGELISPETIRKRLARSLERYDSLVRYSLNAFVISGLLGTLYNLWRLGPDFWAKLLSGQADAGQPAIGIAFSASVFGLSFALILSFYDSFFIKHPKEQFLTESSSLIFNEASRILPPRESAAVAQALQNFYDASAGFLTKLKSDHEQLSRDFIEQIRGSSNQLIDTLDRIGSEWEELTKKTTQRHEQAEKSLATQVSSLTSVTEKLEGALTAALPELDEARKLIVSLSSLRKDAESLQSEITNRIAEYGKQWSTDLAALTQAQINRVEETYQTGWSRYEQLAKESQSRNTQALQQFSESISGSIQEWKAERDSLGQHVNTLLSTWRSEFARATTGITAELEQVRSESDSLSNLAGQMLLSYDAAFRQLQELQSTVSTFSEKVVDGTPLGNAITEMNSILRDIGSVVGQVRSQPPSVVVNESPQSQVILQEIVKVSRGVSKLQSDFEVLRAQGGNRAREPDAVMNTDDPAPNEGSKANAAAATTGQSIRYQTSPSIEDTPSRADEYVRSDPSTFDSHVIVDNQPSFFAKLRDRLSFWKH
jgi:predicted  nucleic acid-binding Zn-ribbon protein